MLLAQTLSTIDLWIEYFRGGNEETVGAGRSSLAPVPASSLDELDSAPSFPLQVLQGFVCR